ncbi:hypothetical protein BC936DRAFT_148569 [Jimgerdemannia flammicorona]|uniref:Uncharacterized protein n=1 Tax=Jimgerdemannia flammicorona TaxID=994334 RepID=A0A433D2Q8_9FUNG|nr:hypothetical protein BC936DRAFT_148569 [Jimgerdemannia flammicorona]
MPLPYPVSFTVLNLLYYPPFLLFYYLLTHLTTPPTRLFAAALFSLYYVIFPVFITTTWLPIDFALSAAGFVFLMRFLDASRRPYAVTCDLPLDQFWLETHALPVRGAFDGKASRQWRMGGVHKLARFGMKFAVLKWVAPWLTVSAREAVEMYAWGTARGMWWDAVYGMVFYLFLGMIGDVAFGTYQVMSGVEMEDIFDTPFLAER